MSKQFKGFEGKDTEVLEASDSNSESTYLSDLAEYDSTPESRETSPSRSYPVDSTVTVVRKDQTGKVKKLVEHFSQSDSDSSDRTVRSTRRKRSKNLDHQELPQGGLREVRRKMAAQESADRALRVNEALLEDLTENLSEAQKALDENKPRAILLGELEGVQQAQEAAWESVDKIMTFQNKPDIIVNFEQLEIKVNKIKIRTRKVLGYLKAATEVNGPIESTTIKVVTPMNFGDIELPEFDGDYTKFEPFEGNWTKLIVNGKLDDGSKKAYLLKCLKGEARDYIGSEGTAAKNYEDIWAELRQRYGKPWRVTRAAVKKLLNIPDPRDDSKDILRYWNEISEACKTAERLGMTASSVILNMALLKLPADYRSKMDDKLKPISKDYVLTRQMVTEPFNDVIAIELERPKNIISTLGFSTSAAPTEPNQHPSFPPRTGNRGGKPFFCLLCYKQTNHRTAKCTEYSQGQQARARMNQLGRCGNCAVVRDEHGEKCSHRAFCNAHPDQRHHYWLCDSRANRGSGSHLPTKPAQQQRKWKIDNNKNPQA